MKRVLMSMLLGVLTAFSAVAVPPEAKAQPEQRRVLRFRGAHMLPRMPRMLTPPRYGTPFPLPPTRRINRLLAPQDVIAMLAARQLVLIGEMRRSGQYYILNARGPHGEMVSLVVNAATGRIEGERVRGPR